MPTSSTGLPFGPFRWGVLARREPFSGFFGIDRGTPIDRVYINAFLASNAAAIRGRCLEVADDGYTRSFGGDRVTHVDVLDIDSTNTVASLIADLAKPGSLQEARYDCAIVTQTLQYVADPAQAIQNLHDCLASNGTLLVTVPGITRLDPADGRPTDRWRFTPKGLFDLLASPFGHSQANSIGYGDLQSATAFLYGLAAEDIGLAEGDERISDFAVVVCAKATRA